MMEAGVVMEAGVAVGGGAKAALCLYRPRDGEGRRPGTGWLGGGHSTFVLERGRLGIEDIHIQAHIQALVVALATHCKRLRVDIFR